MKLSPNIFILILFSTFAETKAQSVLSCLVDGAYLPVAEIRSTVPYCFTGDGVVRGKKKQLALFPAERFAEGFVEIEIRRNQRAGVVKRDGILLFTSQRDWYSFIATIIPDRDLPDCYFAFGFDHYGVKSYYTKALGDLVAGKKRTIRVYTKLGYEMPDQIHIFSGMEELRTSLIPNGYFYQNGHLLLAAR